MNYACLNNLLIDVSTCVIHSFVYSIGALFRSCYKWDKTKYDPIGNRFSSNETGERVVKDNDATG